MVWQINYAGLPQLMRGQAKADKVMAAMMTMIKIDIATLEAAAQS